MNKHTIKTIQKILFPALLPLAGVYWVVITIKKFLYASGILRIRKVPAAVVSIGNITTGGTGKTPLTIELAKRLVEKGLKPAVVMRGYGRKKARQKRAILLVSDGEKILAGVNEAGDEALMMAKELARAPVIVSPDKYAGSLYASQKLNANIILLDDGFQHTRLFRDYDIVLIDCLDPFGGGFLLPLGLLREPVSSLKRAAIICLTNCSTVEKGKADSIVKRLRTKGVSAPVVRFNYKVTGFRNLITGKKVETNWLQSKPVNAFCALGNPESFKKSLESAGTNLKKYNIYPDHHYFTIDEILKILENNVITVTTNKDAARIEPLLSGISKAAEGDLLLVQEISPEIISGKEDWENIINIIVKTAAKPGVKPAQPGP